MSDAHDSDPPWLLTPGPLTTSPAVKAAMQRDHGSREPDFVALTAVVRERLRGLANGGAGHTCVPLQGSGTFAVEAMLSSLVPRDGHLMVASNGAYGRRMAAVAERAGRTCTRLDWPEDTPVDPDPVAAHLDRDPTITDVALVHCETTTGILNPLHAVAQRVAARGRRVLVDAMSSFGVLPIDLSATPVTALAASANKALEGVPGVAFCLVERGVLAAAEGRASTLSLDLHDQAAALDATGQWRFTPPTHVMLALRAALDELEAEGGVRGRHTRYAANARTLIDGMRDLGFRTVLADRDQAPVIVTFREPGHSAFGFAAFHDAMRRRGFAIYPGKLRAEPAFRMGCMGCLGEAEMRAAIDAVRDALAALGVPDGRPA